MITIVFILATACSPATPSPTALPTAAKAATAPIAGTTPVAQAASTQPRPAATAPSAQPAGSTSAGELKIAVSSLAMEQWDPSKSTPSIKFLHRFLYDNLVGVDPVGNKISNDAGLTRGWQLTPDAMKLTLNIRKGVKFHNGDELTADDVKYALDRVIGPNGTSSYAGAFRQSIRDTVVSDPYTLVINMKQPSPLLPAMLSLLSGLEGEVYPKKHVEQNGEGIFLKNPMGTGPYKLVEQVPSSRFVFEAFEDYWRGAPKYKRITLLLVPEEATRGVMLKRGEVDVAEVSRDNVAELKKAGLNIFVKEASAVFSIWMQMGKSAAAAGVPVTKLPVRRALSLAINRQQLVDSLFYGQATPAGALFGSYALEYEPLAPDPFDPQRAKQLLAEAGYPNGFPLDYWTFQYAGFSELGKFNEAVAGYWKGIGVDVRLKPIEMDAWLVQLRKGDLQKLGTVDGFPLQNQALTLSVYQGSLHPQGRNSYAGLGDDFLFPELAALIDKTATTVDDTQRLAIHKQVQKYVYDYLPAIPVVQIGNLFATQKGIAKWDMGKLNGDYNFRDLFRSW